jgi:hypothetical protein
VGLLFIFALLLLVFVVLGMIWHDDNKRRRKPKNDHYDQQFLVLAKRQEYKVRWKELDAWEQRFLAEGGTPVVIGLKEYVSNDQRMTMESHLKMLMDHNRGVYDAEYRNYIEANGRIRR